MGRMKEAVAKRAVATAHGVNAQQLKQADEHRQPAANDGLAVFANAWHIQRVDVASINQALAQPIQLAQGDGVVHAGAARLAQRRQHGAHGA